MTQRGWVFSGLRSPMSWEYRLSVAKKSFARLRFRTRVGLVVLGLVLVLVLLLVWSGLSRLSSFGSGGHHNNKSSREQQHHDKRTPTDEQQEKIAEAKKRREEELERKRKVQLEKDVLLSDYLELEKGRVSTARPEEIAIITLYDNITTTPGPIGGRYMDILDMSLDNKRRYAEKHGYAFHVDLHMWIDKDRPVAWSKLLAIRERLKQYRWVMWVDLDTLFMNYTITLDTLLDDRFDFIATRDGLGLNSGVMFFRNTDWSRDFLTESYNQTQFLIHKDIYEQRAVQLLVSSWEEREQRQKQEERDSRPMGEPEAARYRGPGRTGRHVKFLPQFTMNSYTMHHKQRTDHHSYEEGEFMLHMAGCRHIPICHKRFFEIYKFYYEMTKE